MTVSSPRAPTDLCQRSRQAGDDPFAPAEIGPLDPAKVALVAAAFGDDYRYDSGPDSDSGPESAGDRAAGCVSEWPGRPQLPVAALEARLAALEAAHAAEPERRQQIRQQRRQLRSLAERKAELEAALMETGAGRGDGAPGPDDASLHLYRRTAASFEQRRMKLQDMVFHPVRRRMEPTDGRPSATNDRSGVNDWSAVCDLSADTQRDVADN